VAAGTGGARWDRRNRDGIDQTRHSVGEKRAKLERGSKGGRGGAGAGRGGVYTTFEGERAAVVAGTGGARRDRRNGDGADPSRHSAGG